TLFKVARAKIGIMYVFKIGPSILIKAYYSTILFEKLMMPLRIFLLEGAISVYLSQGHRLIDFVGVYMDPIIRTIFKTPRQLDY
ncbi:histidine transporter, partial [Staphylococcus aureus]